VKAAFGSFARLAALALLAASPLAQADPMRPLGAAQVPAASAAPAGDAASGAAPAPRGPRLVAIRQDSTRRWQALIGENWVTVGDRVGQLTVRVIDANTVQLGEGRARRTLQLLPALTPTAVPFSALLQAGSDNPQPNRAEALHTQ
jgi:hypothetical protein